jgi:HlyD family secretion protein
VLADESRTGTDERALSSAVGKLATELNKAVAAAVASRSGPTRSGAGSTSGGSGSGGSDGAAGRSAQPVSAARIAADQAAVDAARAQLAAARQNLAAATLTSPIAGTVADVTVTDGQQAAAGSTDAAIVVIGDGQDEVTTAVTDGQVGQVEPGDHATVTPDGATTPIQGTVTRIGALGTTTSSGAASYPVTISLAGTAQRLFAGATASVAITLRTAKAAVTVPTSAVREFGGFAVVSKLVAGKATSTRVTIGARGPELTQVTSGLRAGDRVVLADLDQPLPTSNDTLNRARLARGFAARTSGR